MLEEYRCKILPDVIERWENLAEAEQERIKKINFYFCGLHYVVGLADQAEGALKVFDRLLYNETPMGSLAHGYSKNSESGTLRLIKTLCKAVQQRGCEKSGRMVDFDLSLDGITGNPLAQFKGNRFNIIFYNAGIVYYLQKNCKKFFNNVFEENRYYQRIQDLCLIISNDATGFLNGDVIFFDDFEIDLMKKDHIYDRLMEKSEEFDELTKQLLEILFGSFSIITKRMLHDHLKGDKYDQPSDTLV